jgi:hypothetical protein
MTGPLGTAASACRDSPLREVKQLSMQALRHPYEDAMEKPEQ